MARTSKIPAGVSKAIKAKAAAVIKGTGKAVTHVWGATTWPDHNNLRCVDFMVSNRHDGDAVAAYLRANASRLGVQGLIWNRQVMGFPSNGTAYRGPEGGWRAYLPQPGVAYSPHTDHVHAQFTNAAIKGTGSAPATSRPRRFKVVASSLYGLDRAGGSNAKKLHLRKKGFVVVAARVVNGPDGRRWAVTRWGTFYCVAQGKNTYLKEISA